MRRETLGHYAATGRSVALVGRDPARCGGTCINVACVPTKDLVVSAAATREILGATLFCVDSQELVNLVALAMRAGTTADELLHGV